MDTEDDSVTYLKFLNDGIGDSFLVEPFLAEIEAVDWPSEALPILLNSSTTSGTILERFIISLIRLNRFSLYRY